MLMCTPLLAVGLIIQRARPPQMVMLPRLGDEADCLFDLLLQRAVQTCCFTARSCRDPPTATWLARSADSDAPEAFEREWAEGFFERHAAQTDAGAVKPPG
jgi:hypothetical protein